MLNPPILPYLNGPQPTFSVKAMKCQLCTPTEGAQSTEELWALRGLIPRGSKLPDLQKWAQKWGLVPEFLFKKLQQQQQQQQQQLHGHSIGKMVIKCDEQILIVGFNPSAKY